MQKEDNYVVVVGGAKARLFSFAGRGQPLVPSPIHTLNAPEVNKPADTQGVTFSSVGGAPRKLMPHNSNHKDQRAFAVAISRHLKDRAANREFARLILIAAPQMLGILRQELDLAVRSKIWFEIDKDLVRSSTEMIEKTINDHLWSV